MSAHDEWSRLRPRYVREWQSRHAGTGVTWSEIEEAFHYGWEAGRDSRYAAYAWEEAEPDLAAHWYRPQLTSEESSWDYVQEAVHEGWDQGRSSLRDERENLLD